MSFFSKTLIVCLAICLLPACNKKILKGPEPTVAAPNPDIQRGKAFGIEEMPVLPVVKLNKAKRLSAVQVLFFDSKTLGEVEHEIVRLKETGINSLIFRVFQNRGDRIYPFAEAKAKAGVYFNTSHAPVVDDLLGDIVEIGHRHGMEVYAWMTTRYADYGVEERADWHAMGYDLESGKYERAKGLNLFHPGVRTHLLSLYEDLTNYDIDGILFQDDLVLRHTEGFSREAIKSYALKFGDLPAPSALYENVYKNKEDRYMVGSYSNVFWQWSRWKNENLLDIAEGIMRRVKGIKPEMKFAINMMYEAAIKPDKALAWLSQDLEAAVERGFDYYAVMAYHRQMGKEMSLSGDELSNIMGLLVKETLVRVGDPDRALIKLQVADWNTGKIIPYGEMNNILSSVKKNGATSLAFVPYREEFDLSRLSGINGKRQKMYVKNMEGGMLTTSP